MKNFQNLYEVRKTLRFELKPSENTFARILEKTEKNDFYDLAVDEVVEKIKEFSDIHKNELKKINTIWEILINGDKTQIFISSQFLEKLYKYSFFKKGIKEPKKLPKKIQRITIKELDNYLENFQKGNIKVYQQSLWELKKIVKNYKNGKGKENTGLPKRVEIFQFIRKVSNIYLNTKEILSCLRTDTVLRDDYNKGTKVSFLSSLKVKVEKFFENSDIQEESEKYLRTLSRERDVGIESFSLNKYAVNNFK